MQSAHSRWRWHLFSQNLTGWNLFRKRCYELRIPERKGFLDFNINHCQTFLDNSYMFGALPFFSYGTFHNNAAKCFTVPDESSERVTEKMMEWRNVFWAKPQWCLVIFTSAHIISQSARREIGHPLVQTWCSQLGDSQMLCPAKASCSHN